MVTNIDARGVTFKRGKLSEVLAAKTVLWAGGVTATSFGRKLAERTTSESDGSGRIKVNRDLTIPISRIFFINCDLAYAVDEKGAPLPGVARKSRSRRSVRAKVIRHGWKGRKSCRLSLFQ